MLNKSSVRVQKLNIAKAIETSELGIKRVIKVQKFMLKIGTTLFDLARAQP